MRSAIFTICYGSGKSKLLIALTNPYKNVELSPQNLEGRDFLAVVMINLVPRLVQKNGQSLNRGTGSLSWKPSRISRLYQGISIRHRKGQHEREL